MAFVKKKMIYINFFKTSVFIPQHTNILKKKNEEKNMYLCEELGWWHKPITPVT